MQMYIIATCLQSKFLADGTHEKFKSHMVMNWNEQDPDMYPNRKPVVAYGSYTLYVHDG